MLYNLDKNTKKNILDQYKQEALNYRQKKQNERLKRIQEEREYILECMRKEKEAELRLKEEKIQKQNEQMKEYYALLKNLNYDKPGYHHNSRNNEIINKNWGKSRFESYDQNINKMININNLENSKNNKINNNEPS